jgi:hypothetical protein
MSTGSSWLWRVRREDTWRVEGCGILIDMGREPLAITGENRKWAKENK